MANKPLKSITFPGLTDTYTIPQIDTSLTVGGKAADAQAVGNKFTEVSATAYNAFPTDTLSGDIVTFADGADGIPMKSVKVAIEPVQDLHGQDAPYPAGGGKNILDIEAYIASRSSDYTVDSDGWITFNPALASVYANKWVVGDLKARSAILLIDTATQLDGVKLRVYNGNTAVASTPSGNPSSSKIENREFDRIGFDWTSSSDNTKTVKVKVAIVDDATIDAWSPYSNICPISGWTGAQVVRTGVNVWDEEWESGYINNSTGEFVASQNYICTKNFISIVPGKSYYIKTPVALKLIAYDANKTFLRAITSTWANEVITGSTHLSDVYYIKFYNAASGALTTYNHDISINCPSTDHDYHPFTGNDTYSITFPTEAGTVYGGTLDVTTGTLTVDRAMVDLGTLLWVYKTTDTIAPVPYFSVDSFTSRREGSTNLVCSQYANASGGRNTLVDKSCSTYNTNNSKSICIADSSYTDADAFKTAMDGVQLVYELATPITYHLTPTEIKSLLGDNNVWADAGNTEVTYRADTKLYIEKKIAEVINALS